MAQIGVVNVKFVSSVGGLTAGVDSAGKAFKALGGDTATLRASLATLNNLSKQGFLEIGPTAGAAKTAFDGISASVEALVANFRSGSTSAEQFIGRMSALTAEAKRAAQATAEAAAITRENTTAEQDYFAALDRIAAAVLDGGLAEDVASRAREAAYQTYLTNTAAIDRQAEALARLGAATDALGGAADNPFAGIADSFAAGAGAAESFIAATQGVDAAVAQQAAALDLATIAAEQQAAMMARGAEVQRSVATAADVHATAIEELGVLQAAGAISAETYAAAVARQNDILAQADESAAAARKAAEDLASAHTRGAAVTRGVMTASEQYAAKIADLRDLLNQGAISQQTFDRAAAAAASEMRKAKTAADSMSSGLAGISSRLNILIGLDVARIFGSIASTVGNAVGSFIRMGQAEAGVIDQTSKLAARLGVTYGEMAGLSLAAEKSGVSMESMKDAMTKADVAFANAAGGSQQAAAAFARVGLSAQQLNGMGTADRFQAIAAAIAELPTEAERAAAAVQIFGRSGADLLPLFEGGAAGIASAREEADKFGLALTTAQGTDVKDMVSAFETAQNAIQGIVQQVTAYLSPAITGVVNQFNEFIANVGGANIGQMIGEGILSGAEFLAGIGDWLIANLSSVWQYVSDVSVSWNQTITFMQQVGAVFKALFDAGAVLFLSVVRIAITPFSNIIEQLANLASYLPGVAGDVAEQVAAGAKGLRDGIDGSIKSFGQSALKNLDFATSVNPQQTGKQLAGPLTTALNAWRTDARESKDAIEEVKNKPLPDVKKTVEVNIAQALKAVDSRSKEGVAEMFRLMRGDTGNVQEKQLEALQTIADNTSGMEDLPAVALAGA